MRKILIVTERRADYSRFKPILNLIEKSKELDYHLVVTGIHLLEKYGNTIEEIKSDGFKISDTFDMFQDWDGVVRNVNSGTTKWSNVAALADDGALMMKGFSNAVSALTDIIKSSKPDIILSGFDIGANLAITIVGAHMNVPIAHIQGGEVSGTIDESIRHAMSKFSHYHFCANEDARQRLIKMGEEPDKIFDVGCPSLDALIDVEKLSQEEIFKNFGIDIDKKYLVVLQHPVTTELGSSKNQIEETITAVKESGVPAIMIYPNNDAGSNDIISKICESGIKYVPTLSLKEYVSLMSNCSALIGNSSSGIHETQSFKIPTINIGTRQQGRLRSINVIDVDYDSSDIENAIETALYDKDFINKVSNGKNLYGEGDSADKIVKKLEAIDISSNIIQKQITY